MNRRLICLFRAHYLLVLITVFLGLLNIFLNSLHVSVMMQFTGLFACILFLICSVGSSSI